ncbi:OpgC domain-containing protein [Nocardioides solisilvae]|uniref:OpgC domain-containing protein n=1 Tax=Nocardioides solisilvae TaxID=1542435 RepID=UPI000D748B6F|nr:OpgC domain-containing protein [Nocardioides solisilvae]
MTTAAAALATLVLAAIAVVQVAAAAGRPVGRFVWGGQHEVLPRGLRLGSAVSVALYAAMAFVLVARATGREGALTILTWVLVGYFALGIVMNAVSRSRSERAVMTPACAVLAGCSLLVALGS